MLTVSATTLPSTYVLSRKIFGTLLLLAVVPQGSRIKSLVGVISFQVWSRFATSGFTYASCSLDTVLRNDFLCDANRKTRRIRRLMIVCLRQSRCLVFDGYPCWNLAPNVGAGAGRAQYSHPSLRQPTTFVYWMVLLQGSIWRDYSILHIPKASLHYPLVYEWKGDTSGYSNISSSAKDERCHKAGGMKTVVSELSDSDAGMQRQRTRRLHEIEKASAE